MSPKRGEAAGRVLWTGAAASLMVATGLYVAPVFAQDGGTPSTVVDAGGVVADAGPVFLSGVADPVPLRASKQWVFEFRHAKGEVFLSKVREESLPAPRETPRVMGRFALELRDRDGLIERVRFDFPMMAPVPIGDAGLVAAPNLEQGLTTRVGVYFPATDRGTKLELVDRMTKRRYPLEWPPAVSAKR